VAIPSLFMNLTEVTDLTSIGTLFAFVLVSGGIIVLNPLGKETGDGKGFRVPYADSRRYLIPIWTIVIFMMWKSGFDFSKMGSDHGENYNILLIIRHHYPSLIFLVVSLVISYKAVMKRWSLIPVLGLLTNLYLMSELGATNWFRFGIWLVVGLLIYFSYGFKNSRIKEDSPNNTL
jgi:hypothetical protein